MDIKDIRTLNNDIYSLDDSISRESKTIFVATLVIVLCLEKDFQNVDNLTKYINFASDEKKPIDQLVDLAKEKVKDYGLSKGTLEAIDASLDTIKGANTNLNSNKKELCSFIERFITNFYKIDNSDDLFFETLYMEIDKKAKKKDSGTILTPKFIAKLMIDLLDLDYKTDVLADLCAGTGLFSILGYTKMYNDLESDYKRGILSDTEHRQYSERLSNSIIANDRDEKMVTLCFANFLLKNLNGKLLYHEDCLDFKKYSFKIQKKDCDESYPLQVTKAILNPPYEDSLHPLEILEKNIELVQGTDKESHKVIAILPAVKFSKSRNSFYKILLKARLECVIKTQKDLFIESGTSAQPASIFVFDASRAHRSDDIVRYYDFSDSGYVYKKDSGLVDDGSYETKKDKILELVHSEPRNINTLSERKWNNFYDVQIGLETLANINPEQVKISEDDADISIENITIKKALKEKKELIDGVNNSYVDSSGEFEDYIVSILSEDI